ncbi:hypothetical protein OHA21_13980 [Actinoplanes sp. NBC_00393]|uniref:hypothetical protein n=1 Tax=Actinoplanes sp. NBC_00393 TaxID=2975953 RepID=UPI002E1FC65D
MNFDVLAMLIREDLGAAGLPVLPVEYSSMTSAGATVQPDDSGVVVGWRVHYALMTVGMHEYSRLQRGGPGARFHGAVSDAMRDAMAEILTAAGYTLEKDYNDYAPYDLLVTAGPADRPSWRDWHDAQDARRHAIQHRLLTKAHNDDG